jgi:hypothetical protein
MWSRSGISRLGWLAVVSIRYVGQSLRTGIGDEITGPKAR